MRKRYSIKVWDEAIYPDIYADDETEAMNQAWDFFNERKDKMTMMITSTYEADSKVNFVRLSKSNIDFLVWLNNNGYLDSEIKYKLVENEIDF